MASSASTRTGLPRRNARAVALAIGVLVVGLLIIAGLLWALPQSGLQTPPGGEAPAAISPAPTAPHDPVAGRGDGDIEGPSTAPTPDPDDAWGRETEPFTNGAAGTVLALEITQGGAQPSEPWQAFDGNPLKLYDINGNGRAEIIAQNDNHWVYVFDSLSGALLAELKSSIPEPWGARTFNGVEAAVLERGGDVHIVTANSASVIAAYRFNAEESSATQFVFDEAWEVRVNDCFWHSGMDAKVVLADLTLDGNLEILAATEEFGVYALRHDGTQLWRNCLGGGNAAPIVADVTANGWPDVVHVSDGGTVGLLNGRTGDWIWGYNIRDHFDLHSASIPVMAAVGKLSGGAGLDIVVGARDSHDPGNWSANNALLLALNSQGQRLWRAQDPTGNPLTYTRPVIVDADGDGESEVYWADWNTVGHHPPDPSDPEAWLRTGPANFYRYSASGELVWKRTLDTWWSNKDIPIADVTGDGAMELLANGPNDEGRDGIWYLDTLTGEKKAWVGLHPYKAQRGPVVGDLWGTGTTQWVIQVAGNAPGSGHALLVFDTQAPHNVLWGHPPGPDLDFDAGFSEVQGGEWWIQLKVRGVNAQIALVEYRINAGDWKAMTDAGWGWTASAQVPQGAMVQFRATSNLFDHAMSGCYEWHAAQPIECPD